MAEMSEETEKSRFRYMLEFPNKIRVYSTDEKLLSSILEKYGMPVGVSTMINTTPQVGLKDGKSVTQLPTLSRCPECASNRIVFDNERGETICLNCGFTLHGAKQVEKTQKPSLDSKTRFKIFESQNGYKIVCKSDKASYTTCVSKATVEETYRFLKADGRKFRVKKIEMALKISNVSVHNALRVLRFQGKAGFEVSDGPGRSGQFLYWAT